MLLARLTTSRAIGLQMSHRQGGAKAEGDGSSLILVLWRRGSKKKRKTYSRTLPPGVQGTLAPIWQ